MLGYDVDFGHMEAVSLISAPKYPEKQASFCAFHAMLVTCVLSCFYPYSPLLNKLWIHTARI